MEPALGEKPRVRRPGIGGGPDARPPETGGDRPPAPGLHRQPPADVVLAMDVGGTLIKAGLVDARGDVVREARRPTGVEAGPEAVIDGILSFAGDLTSGQPVRAVGIGVPGVVDGAAGIARYAANLGWRDVPFARLMSDRIGVPAVLGHDVRNGALAEARLGAGAGGAGGAGFGGEGGVGDPSVYFVAIGTGIAGGLVRHGELDNGATGQAGEIGHLVVRPGGLPCNCGNRGCLETIASASRIAAAYRAATRANATARLVADRARAGEPVAGRIWADAVDALADALTAMIVLTDPGSIVIGGGLSLAGATLLDPLLAALPPRLTFREPPPVLLGLLGDRAGLIGAALRAWDLVGADVAVGAP